MPHIFVYILQAQCRAQCGGVYDERLSLIYLVCAFMAVAQWTVAAAAVQGSGDAALYCTLFRLYEIAPFVIMGIFRSVCTMKSEWYPRGSTWLSCGGWNCATGWCSGLLLNLLGSDSRPVLLCAAAFFLLSFIWYVHYNHRG